MKWNEAKKGQSFCVLPFIHSATLTDGSIPLCCVSKSSSKIDLNESTMEDYWNSSYVKDIRRKMLQGEQIKDCSRCYEEEKSGYRSHRLIENKAWEEKLGEKSLSDILSKVDGSGHTEQGIVSVDLRLGNTCNLQCVMCRPQDSSKWKSATPNLLRELSERKLSEEWREKNNINIKKFEWYKNVNFWEHLKSCLPTLRELIIGGGEPMLIKEHLEFIKFCVKSGEAQHIHLRYHTNMTVFPEEMIPYWSQFERVEFFASIDGMGEVADYVRYPSVWKDVKANLLKVDQLGDNVWLRLLYSVHALNIKHLPEFLKWVNNQKFKKEKLFLGTQSFVHPGIVHWPEYLNIKVLPQDYKDEITQDIKNMRAWYSHSDYDKYEGLIQFMNSEDWSEKIPLTRDYVKALDKTRKTDSFSVFPELSEHLLSY